jgi:hypothetical protein
MSVADIIPLQIVEFVTYIGEMAPEKEVFVGLDSCDIIGSTYAALPRRSSVNCSS